MGKLSSPNDLPFQILLGCSLGSVFGIASRWISPLVLFGILIAVVFIYAALKRPGLALLGILIATSSIIFEEQLPILSMGGISLHIPDLFLLSLLGLIVLRWLVKPGFKIMRTPLDWPLLIFLGITLLSTFIAIFQSSVDSIEARRAVRAMAYFLTFFVVTNLVRERRQLNLLLNGLFLLATIVAVAMVVQFLLGSSVTLLPGRVEGLRTQNEIFGDITRILPPGFPIILVSFISIFCILVLNNSKSRRSVNILQCILMGIALLFTFLRSYWAVLIIVFILLALIVRAHERQRLIGWSLVVMCLLAFVLIPVFISRESGIRRLVNASFSRLATLWSPKTLTEGSLQGRYVEAEYAIPQIISHPFLGLGLGAQYRPFDSRIDLRGTKSDFRGYIHNGHLWILLDTGLLGYLAFIWLSIAFLSRGFRYWRSIADDRMRGIMLGFTLTYLSVLIAALVNPTFTEWKWTPVIGIMMGINEAILRKFQMK